MSSLRLVHEEADPAQHCYVGRRLIFHLNDGNEFLGICRRWGKSFVEVSRAEGTEARIPAATILALEASE